MAGGIGDLQWRKRHPIRFTPKKGDWRSAWDEQGDALVIALEHAFDEGAAWTLTRRQREHVNRVGGHAPSHHACAQQDACGADQFNTALTLSCSSTSRTWV